MSELQMLQEELAELPTEERESWAGWFRRELRALREHDAWYEGLTPTQRDRLRAMVQEGVDSGDAGLLDVKAIRHEARAEWEAREQRT